MTWSVGAGEGGSWKEALILVNGISLKKALTLLRTTDNKVLRMICECRRDRPEEYDDLLESAGILALDHMDPVIHEDKPVRKYGGANFTRQMAQRLMQGWVTLDELALATNHGRKQVANMLAVLPHRRRLTIEKRRRPDMPTAEYRALPG